MAGPALPWARPGGRDSTTVERDLPAKLGLNAGVRIEIKWLLADGEGDQIVWWPATLERRVEGETDGEGRCCYAVVYDAAPELEFHQPTRNLATFLSEHELYQLEQDGEGDAVLPWRREGELWEEEDMGDERERIISFQEVEEGIRASERIRGKTVDQECVDLLATLPEHQRTTAAQVMGDAIEHFKEAVEELVHGKGPEYVICEDDVKAMMANMMSTRRRQQGGR